MIFRLAFTEIFWASGSSALPIICAHERRNSQSFNWLTVMCIYYIKCIRFHLTFSTAVLSMRSSLWSLQFLEVSAGKTKRIGHYLLGKLSQRIAGLQTCPARHLPGADALFTFQALPIPLALLPGTESFPALPPWPFQLLVLAYWEPCRASCVPVSFSLIF